ncbi:hypothetical protein ACHHYP_00070 [Achlya hypogyna]|uniref:Uncharacterized protein n=1 Tax=Achlya hypogyna TaxID=1202772 RepID=A0A1V9ZCP3_ACHHY|nr:hypothetical protein ACHHYP_00070 [Achlya hypogyna]
MDLRTVSPPPVPCPTLAHRLEMLESLGSPKAAGVRDRIRDLHALSLAPFPAAAKREGLVSYPALRHGCCRRRSAATLYMGITGLTWAREVIPIDDLVGAVVEPDTTDTFTVHFARKQPNCDRVFDTRTFTAPSPHEATAWVHGLQLLVQWHSRVPATATRRVLVLFDPRCPTAAALWTECEPYFALGRIQITLLSPTTPPFEHGRQLCASDDVGGVEALLLLGEGRTLDEFLNGVLAHSTDAARALVARLPVALLPCYMREPFSARSRGSPTLSAVIFSVITRKLRPIDVLARLEAAGTITVACAGVGFGAASLAKYTPLPATVAYDAMSDPQTYDPGEGVALQHTVEVSSPYHLSSHSRAWSGSLSATTVPLTTLNVADDPLLVGLSITKAIPFDDMPAAALSLSDGQLDVRLVYEARQWPWRQYRTVRGKSRLVVVTSKKISTTFVCLPHFVMICSEK